MLSRRAREWLDRDLAGMLSEARWHRIQAEALEFGANTVRRGLLRDDTKLMTMADDGCPIADAFLESGSV